MIAKIANWGYGYPLSVHLLLTTRCNLNCRGCFYRGEPSEIPLERALSLLREWAGAGVKSVAVGGGEPTLYPNIGEVVSEAKRLGLYVALTSNGVYLREWEVPPDRVHISFDEMHSTDIATVRRAIDHYRACGVERVGVNHIVTSLELAEVALSLEADTVTLLLEKPRWRFGDWSRLSELILSNRDRVWLDACLARLLRRLGVLDIPAECRQGITSMSLGSDLKARLCSNSKEGVPYSSLQQAWRDVRRQACPIFSSTN
jgi:MoaA/NifB/PqqE/SkfB family radical SAM enzyme